MPSQVATAAAWIATGTKYATLAKAASASYYAAAVYSTAYVATAAGLSMASQSIFGRDVPGGAAGSGTDLGQKLRMNRSPAEPEQVIYGTTRVGSDLIFYDVTNGGKDLHMVAVFAGHPCESIEEIYVDGNKMNLDSNGVAQGKYSKANVVVNKHLGDQTTADSDLVERVKVWGENHIGQNKTYVYFRGEAENREDHRELFSGLPEISALVKGKNDIYDPRDDSFKWTNNPALITRDFITDERYGYGFRDTMIKDNDVVASANNCEEQIDGKNRYTCNGTFRDDRRKDDVLRDLLTSMAGETVWSQGQQRILSGMWRPTVDTYDESQIIDAIDLETKQSRSDLFNTVRGTFANPGDNYQPTSFPQVQEDQYVEEDDNTVIPKSIELQFTTDADEAQRVSRIMLRKKRLQENLSTTLNIEAFNAQPGDNVALNLPRYSWEPKNFHVSSWGFRLEDGSEDEAGFRPMIDMELDAREPDVYNTGATGDLDITSPAVEMA